jgi:hypothetical protein
MKVLLLWGLAAFYLITGLFIAIMPFGFYEIGPGVADTGPYNMHFLRDVGFAFTVSALGLGYGLHRRLKPLVVFGTAWLTLHGLFHLTLWLIHPSATGTVNDLALVVLPAALTTYLALTYNEPQHG